MTVDLDALACLLWAHAWPILRVGASWALMTTLLGITFATGLEVVLDVWRR